MDDKQYPNKETKELFGGVVKGDEEVVKVLLLGNKNKQFELDINFRFKNKKTGWTALHFAALNGFEQIVKILLEYGSNVHLQTSDGRTALHIAAQNGWEQVVKILVEHGSNLDLQTDFGKTALHFAAREGFEEVVKILIEHGSNINIQTKYGHTVLDVTKDQNIVELIIQSKGRTIKPAQQTKKEN